MVVPEIPAYLSPASGKMITSRRERREDLIRTGNIPWEPGIKEQIERRRQDLIKADEALVDRRVDETVGALHASGVI